jgi:ribosomal peptide maturation radical SAM protein 1
MGKSLRETFPHIDFIISGEGELPLVRLINYLAGLKGQDFDVSPPGMRSRQDHRGPDLGPSQMAHLDELPIPDYTDYFKQLRALGPEHRFLPRIPMEISRGCWWKKRSAEGRPSGCAFCNLNLQWKGYRAKSPERVLKELDTLTREHQTLSVSFMDNLLPPTGLNALFREIAGLSKDFRLFSEIRAKTSLGVLRSMGDAGMRQVQVGIESLSSSLLKKLNKGTTAMDNLEIMKHCEAQGLPNLTGNLILCFPSSEEQDVAETLRNLDFAMPFRPLKGIPFWLGYWSPVWRMYRHYGIRRVRNHSYYRHLFPPEILRNLTLMIQGYEGAVRFQQRLWKPVREKLEQWSKTYNLLHAIEESPNEIGWNPILSYFDGGDFMIIRQRRHGAYDMTHRLQGTSRRIYLFCETQRSMEEILSAFPGFGEEKVRPFLRMMVDKGLMFHEADRYLTLAVRNRRHGSGARNELSPPGHSFS